MSGSTDQYIDWKDWRDDSFGRFDALEAQYYAEETDIAARPDARVLEIGFGNGPFIGWARSVDAEVFGVELNSILVARARAFLGKNNAFQDLNDEMLAALAGTFSHVVAFDVIEHIHQSELPRFFAQISTLLAPDGRIFLRFPNGDSPFGRLHQHADPTHVTTVGGEKLRFFARQSGLTVEAIRAPKLPLTGSRLSRAFKRNLLHAGRCLVERVVGLLYFGGRTIPLAPNYFAILTRADVEQ
jgi:2-polyprenyl-3-methyl-5-hydroxy-6-metoxy-1,4-benzoquinol methylase